MRILAIRGENLASLEGPFEVELDGKVLGRSGIFSITGPTGAGKSTLLDAMCLALYDQIPRLSDAKVVRIGRQDAERDRENANDVKSIMRRGAGCCRAEVVFIGKDGAQYKAKWEARRARKKPEGRLQDQEVTLERLDTKEVIGHTKTDTLNAIQERIGLTFDQFQRSVLLAQGDFAAFLKADATARADLLERMTGTDIYSHISIAAFERMRAEENELKEISDERGRLEIMGDGDLAELAGALCGLRFRLREEKAVQTRAGKAVAWYERLASLQQQVDAQERAVEAAEQCWDNAASRRDIIARIKEAEPFRSAVQGIDRIAGQREEAKKKRDTARAREQEARTHWEVAQRAVSGISYQLAQHCVEAEQNIRDADQWLSNHDHLGAIEKIWHQCARDIHTLAKKSAALNQEITKAKKLVPALEGLSGADFDKALKVSVVDAGKKLKAAENVRSLDDYRADLVDGEPCPLCGSATHPWASGSPLSSLVRERQALLDALEHIERQISTCKPVLEDNRARMADTLAPLKDWETQVETNAKRFIETLDEDVKQYRKERQIRTASKQLLDRIDLLFSPEDRAEIAASQTDPSDAIWDFDPDGLIDMLGKARKEAQAAHTRATDASATIRAITEQIEALDAEWESQCKLLASDAAVAAISLAELKERLSFAPAWVAAEEKTLAQIDQAFQTARIVLIDRSRLKKAHLDTALPGMTEAQAQTEIVRVDGLIEALHKNIAALEADDKRDRKARERATHLDGEIESQEKKTQLWQCLGKVIGSADGKKFRRFSQSLTLEVLIVHANVHLEALARRYRLERVPFTDMDIQVVDQEMADEIRGVNSLSGGETFLVSLALALGLASLSAREMSVETLFIDEGFGSLDLDTLEIALAALENLQATNRQVGIISHVQGLADCIGAQIKVEKVGAGRSRVLVSEGGAVNDGET
ncbi:MAG: AAA family ATPase [Myxococcota bacterium]|nr:AAA family ATPase [Myxococcota bacterium]